MESAKQQIDNIVKSKDEFRKKLASLPFEEKIQILKVMQRRRIELLRSVVPTNIATRQKQQDKK